MATMLPVLDNSAVNTFNECPRKFYYQYVLHFQKPISAALHFGRVWHKMLDTWYTTGGDVLKAQAAGGLEWGTLEFTSDHRTLARALEAFGKYVKTYGTRDEHSQTIGLAEGAPLVEMAFMVQWDEIPLPYVGKIDRVIRGINMRRYVWDHKTVSRMDASFFRAFEMSSQMIGYMQLTRLMTLESVAGVVINAYNITPTGKSDRFERMTLEVPEARVDHWATVTLPTQMYAIISAHETDTWHQNHASCSGKYGLCHYFDVCTLPEKRRQSFLELNFEVREWNPLATE